MTEREIKVEIVNQPNKKHALKESDYKTTLRNPRPVTIMNFVLTNNRHTIKC